MSLRSVESSPRARIAVVGAPSPEGVLLRDELARRGVPGGRVDLYGSGDGEPLISEYGGEARMIQQPDVSEIAGHDVIFICESGSLARSVAAAAVAPTVVIDLLGCLTDGGRPELAPLPPALPAPTNGSGARCIAVAHPLSWLLAEVLAPIDGELGLEGAIAVVLRPAADFGQSGIEELRQQTVRLLSFSPFPTRTFGRQLAFNIIPAAPPADEQPNLESRIAGEVNVLLHSERPQVAVRLLTAPLFYGHGLQLHVRLRRAADADELRELLRRANWQVSGQREADPTPLDVSGEPPTRAVRLTEDGLGAYWLWVVVGEAGARGAIEAVSLASRLADL